MKETNGAAIIIIRCGGCFASPVYTKPILCSKAV